MPDWARVAMAAKQLGGTAWELIKQPDWEFWLEAGGLLASIESEANERSRKKSS